MAKSQRAGSSPSPQGEQQCRVIAVAKTNVNAVMEEGSALAFKKGDNIIVHGRSAPDVFVGTAHGRTGSFLVQDATFYKGESLSRSYTLEIHQILRSSCMYHMYSLVNTVESLRLHSMSFAL